LALQLMAQGLYNHGSGSINGCDDWDKSNWLRKKLIKYNVSQLYVNYLKKISYENNSKSIAIL
jgi:hypothetical protein